MNLEPQIITKNSPKDIIIKEGDYIENHRFPSCLHKITGFIKPHSDLLLTKKK